MNVGPFSIDAIRHLFCLKIRSKEGVSVLGQDDTVKAKYPTQPPTITGSATPLHLSLFNQGFYRTTSAYAT